MNIKLSKRFKKLKYLHHKKRKKLQFCNMTEVSANSMMTIVSEYINASNQHDLHLELAQYYMFGIFQFLT